MSGPLPQDLGYVFSGAAAFGLTLVLLGRHVLEPRLGRRMRHVIDFLAVPLFLVVVVYIVARPFL